MAQHNIAIPPHFSPESVGKVWKVAYQERAEIAREWADANDIQPAASDTFKICLLLIDVQNTFCIPEFELFVAGRSGVGAVEDNRRLCEFIYRNIGHITHIAASMDTHQAMQIFHSIFLVDPDGKHPSPFTLISLEDVRKGVWKINPNIHESLGISTDYAGNYLQHYVEELERKGKYTLTIWPYHAMLGGIGHALVAAVEESLFFHSVARYSPTDFLLGRTSPLTENYSVIRPEVMNDHQGHTLSKEESRVFEKLLNYDALFIAGQAKSHCVAWTITDLLEEITAKDSSLARKIYLLEDCTSPVVIPGVVDYTDEADKAYREFAEKGMNIVCSTDPLDSLPGIRL